MNCFTSQHCCACPKPGHGFPMPYATVFLCSMVWGKRCGSFWYWWNSWSSITVKTFFSYQVFKLYCFIGLYYQNRWLILKWKIFGRLSVEKNWKFASCYFYKQKQNPSFMFGWLSGQWTFGLIGSFDGTGSTSRLQFGSNQMEQNKVFFKCNKLWFKCNPHQALLLLTSMCIWNRNNPDANMRRQRGQELSKSQWNNHTKIISLWYIASMGYT